MLSQICTYNKLQHINHCLSILEDAAESEPLGSDRRKPTGRVPKARRVFGGGCRAASPKAKFSWGNPWVARHGKSDRSFWQHYQTVELDGIWGTLFTPVYPIAETIFGQTPKSFSSFFCEFGRSAEKLICFVKFLG